MIDEYAARGVHHAYQTNMTEPNVDSIKERKIVGYYKIARCIDFLKNCNHAFPSLILFHARHYKFALSEMFDRRQFRAVVVVEDDLDLAPVSCVPDYYLSAT